MAPGSTKTEVRSVGAGNDAPRKVGGPYTPGPFNEAGAPVPAPTDAEDLGFSTEGMDYEDWVRKTHANLAREMASVMERGNAPEDVEKVERMVNAFDKLVRLGDDLSLPGFDRGEQGGEENVSLDGETDEPDRPAVAREADRSHMQQNVAGTGDSPTTGKRPDNKDEPTPPR